jgi:hypothetical protein
VRRDSRSWRRQSGSATSQRCAGPPGGRTAVHLEILDTHYGVLQKYPVPVSEDNHKRHGVSSTPTLVIVDRAGRVALYNPGRMTKEALEPIIRKLLSSSSRASRPVVTSTTASRSGPRQN